MQKKIELTESKINELFIAIFTEVSRGEDAEARMIDKYAEDEYDRIYQKKSAQERAVRRSDTLYKARKIALHALRGGLFRV